MTNPVTKDLTAGYWAHRHEELCGVTTRQTDAGTVTKRCTKPFGHRDQHGPIAETLVRLLGRSSEPDNAGLEQPQAVLPPDEPPMTPEQARDEQVADKRQLGTEAFPVRGPLADLWSRVLGRGDD